jgi:hypothetical protein
MDWKSIVLNKRMKFFLNFTLISSCLFPYWAYPCDAQDILEPSHLLSDLYSILHIQQPKNDDPNTVYLTSETLVVKDERNDLLISLPKHLHSMMVGTQRAYEYGLCSQHPLKYGHPQNYISVSTNLDSDFEYLPVKRNNDILLPKINDNLNYLSNVNSCGSLTYNKTKTFIETKVTAMKLQGFNL